MAVLKRLRKEINDYFDEAADGSWQHKLCPEVTLSFDRDDMTVWRLSFVGPALSPYVGQELNLHVVFPDDYPFKPPVVTQMAPVPYHPNVQEYGCFIGCDCGPFFCCGCSAWNPGVLTARELPKSYLSLLAAPNLESACQLRAAALFRQSAAEGSEYWIRAAASVGNLDALPLWTPATHSSWPVHARTHVAAALLTLRIFERRLQRAAANKPPPACQDGVWPHTQTLPDEVVSSILALVARDRMARPGACRVATAAHSTTPHIHADSHETTPDV